MNVLEEYTQAEIARLLGCTKRWIEFQIPEAIDEMTCILLECGLMKRIAESESRPKTCQGGRNGVFSVSDSNDGENNRYYAFDTQLILRYSVPSCRGEHR